MYFFGEGLGHGQLEAACRCLAEVSVLLESECVGGGWDGGEEGNLCVLVTALRFLERQWEK